MSFTHGILNGWQNQHHDEPGKAKVTAYRAEIAAKHGLAIQMKRAGRTHDQIAEALGYKSRGSVTRALDAEMKRTVTEPAADMLYWMTSGLKQIRAAHYAAAARGDIPATKIVLQIDERIARLHGLDDFERRMAEVAERRIALDEQQGKMIAGAMMALIERLVLTEPQKAIARQAAPEILRSISAGPGTISVPDE